MVTWDEAAKKAEEVSQGAFIKLKDGGKVIEDLLPQTLQNEENVLVSFSGGKDAVLTYAILRERFPKLKLHPYYLFLCRGLSFVVTCRDEDEKESLLKSIGLDGDEDYISSDDFAKKLKAEFKKSSYIPMLKRRSLSSEIEII